MRVTAIKTRRVDVGSGDLESFLDESLKELNENSVLAITSKVAAICEERVVRISDDIDKKELIKQESNFFLPSELSKYDFSFTIVDRTLIPQAGIDESNGDGHYILWPRDLQKTCNDARAYLREKFNIKNLGVILTDSTARPLHYGTEGVGIGYSGFVPSNNYVGTPDLYGRNMEVSVANILDALASAAVVVMGEGTEQTPLVLIEDLPFVQFQDADPTKEEMGKFYITHLEDDLFEPFLKNQPWQKGGRTK